jgi:hypothetical protein
MKLLIAGIALVFSFSTFAGYTSSVPNTTLPTCKDKNDNVVDGSVTQLRKVMGSNSYRPQVYVTGTVAVLHNDDTSGLPHQKFSLKVSDDITLEIVSNLDFGRIPVAVGQTVNICGEYLHVGRGMVHWTHFDPHGNHADGFTILNGKLYGDKEVPTFN